MSLPTARRMAGVERTLIRQIFDSAPPDAINLGLGQPDLPTPPAVSLAGVAGIAAGRTGYTTTAGDRELRDAVAALYPGFADGPGDVVIHVGSQEALFATLLALVDPGDVVLIPDPGYPGYPTSVRLAGAEPVCYPLRSECGFRLEVAQLEPLLTDRVRAVVLCSPGNPTGAVHSEPELRRLARLLSERGIAWISDEIYAGFNYEGPVPSLSRVSRDGVVVSGLSKTMSMTGWRIGWAVGPRHVAEKITAAHQYLVTCASSVSQVAALAALSPRGCREAERYREIFGARRELMARELSRLSGVRFEPPAGAFYFFVDVRGYGGSLELSRSILERKRVITIPGVAFGQNGEGHLRLSFAASDRDIIRGVRAVGEVLDGS